MPQNPLDVPQNDESSKPDEQKEGNDERFESDTQRIIHRHLQNKDDVITDEDIANVRIGMTPVFDEATESRFEDSEEKEEAESDLLGEDTGAEPAANKDDKLTPWDTIDPSK